MDPRTSLVAEPRPSKRARVPPKAGNADRPGAVLDAPPETDTVAEDDGGILLLGAMNREIPALYQEGMRDQASADPCDTDAEQQEHAQELAEGVEEGLPDEAAMHNRNAEMQDRAFRNRVLAEGAGFCYCRYTRLLQ